MAKGAIGQKPIRLGTLATEDSDWGNALKAMNSELIQESNNQLRFALTFAMDEKRLIDLMRKGQLDAISVTAIGLGWVLEDLFIFQLPMLFTSYEELDYVREKLAPEFAQSFEEKNYVLLSWGDLGFTYLFSKQPIRTQTDLKKTRFWVYDIDPIAEAFASESGKEPVLSPVGNVLSLLRNGDIETVYGPPYGCLALQWYPELNYMSDLILAAGVGATILNKRRYDMLSDGYKRLLHDISEKHHKQLIAKIRERNEESIEILKREGIEIVSIPPREKQKWLSVARRVQNQLASGGKFYTKELLNEIRQLLEQYRRDTRNIDLTQFQRRTP